MLTPPARSDQRRVKPCQRRQARRRAAPSSEPRATPGGARETDDRSAERGAAVCFDSGAAAMSAASRPLACAHGGVTVLAMAPTPKPTSATEPSGRRAGRDRWAPLAVFAVVFAAGYSHLPPGVCHGDSGDLQLACTTAGIMHPPGYALLVSAGYVLTRIPALDPAYLVSVACLASGALAISLAARLMITLGGAPWLAASLALLLAGRPLVWENLITPEVYAPALALLVAATGLFITYGRPGRRRDLFLGAALLGAAIVTRPPLLLAAPGFALAVWASRRAPGTRFRAAPIAVTVACLLLPLAYSIAFFLARDAQGARHNYVAQYFHEAAAPSQSGLSARLERVAWLMTGRQYHGQLDPRPDRVAARWWWAGVTISQGNPALGASVAIAAAIGFVLLGRREPAAVSILGAILAGDLAFVGAYRDYGAAADLLPAMFALCVLVACALASVVERLDAHPRHIAGVVIATATAGALFVSAGERSKPFERVGATEYLRDVDLARMPRGAHIFATWHDAPPLWYARDVLLKREDVEITNAPPSEWAARLTADPGALARVFFTLPAAPPEGHSLAPAGALWRLTPER